MAGFRSFPKELLRRGDPELRPLAGRCVLRRTSRMLARENERRGHALVATILGDRRPISPEQVVVAIERHCGVRRNGLLVEVAPAPDDFFIRFVSAEDCTRVVTASRNVRCGGTFLSFGRWCRGRGGAPSELAFFTKLCFDGLPQESWDVDALTHLINSLDGDLDEVLPPTDKQTISVLAWMKDPSSVPKVYTVEIPDTCKPSSHCMDAASHYLDWPSPPRSPEKRATFEHEVLIHIQEVIDRGPVITGIPGYDLGGGSTKRRHEFAVWDGAVDGTGPPATRDGGHCYGGSSSTARAGDATFPGSF
uniref:Uncharacterized protein n=1 Tax=Avena sativa TaxID=4498 RepID=A0ACD5U750_AVESA